MLQIIIQAAVVAVVLVIRLQEIIALQGIIILQGITIQIPSEEAIVQPIQIQTL